MTKKEIEKKIDKLSAELKNLQDRLSKTLAKSNDLFVHGGDGYHDNQSFELLMADVDKLNSLIDEVREEIAQLKRGPHKS